MALDIVIKVDPTGGVQGADKVTAALGKTEKQGEKTNATLDRMKKSASGADAVATSAGRAASELGKTAQKATEFGKQSFAGVIGQLDHIAGMPLGGAQTVMGFLAGGFIGAAAGLAVSALGGLISKLDETAKHTDTLTKAMQGFDETLAGIDTHLELSSEDWAELSDPLSAQLKRQAGLVDRLKKEETDRTNGIIAAQDALRDQQISYEQYVDVMARLGFAAEKTAESIKKVATADPEIVKLLQGAGSVGGMPAFRARDPYAGYSHDQAVIAAEAGLAAQYSTSGEPDLAADLQGVKAPWEETNAKIKETAELTNKVAEENHQMVLDFGTTVIDQLFRIDQTASETFANIAMELARLAIKQGISSLAGALGGAAHGGDTMVPYGGGLTHLPRFASGGDRMVGGSGGTDSKLVMFRATPGESVHVRTPEQRRGGDAPAGRSGPSSINIHMNREGLVTHDELENLVVKVLDRNSPAIRQRLTGR